MTFCPRTSTMSESTSEAMTAKAAPVGLLLVDFFLAGLLLVFTDFPSEQFLPMDSTLTREAGKGRLFSDVCELRGLQQEFDATAVDRFAEGIVSGCQGELPSHR